MGGSPPPAVTAAPPLVFCTCASSPADVPAVRLLVESVRTFAGELGACLFRVFVAEPAIASWVDLADPLVDMRRLHVPEALSGFPFASVVVASAEAEELATGVESLVWLDPECLVTRPPSAFALDAGTDVAARPVHVSNVGAPRDEPLDPYWRRVYDTVGVGDVDLTVESFVDGRRLRAYFNSHGLAVRPARGLFRRRRDHFERLVADRSFQSGACRDEAHRVFLFQALFGALVGASLERRIRILPPTYCYPYNLHARVPADRRAPALDDLVCFVYEGRSLRPWEMTDVAVREPLRSWLTARAS